MPNSNSSADATKFDPAEVESLLRAKLRQLDAEASSLAVAAPEPGTQVQYGKRAGDHVAEVADRLARSRAAGELEKLEEEVRAAVAKVGAGSYGVCDDCGRPIPGDRMEVLPWATRCVDCQSRRHR